MSAPADSVDSESAIAGGDYTDCTRTDAHEKFMDYVDKVSKHMEPSFTCLTASNSPKFIAKGNPTDM